PERAVRASSDGNWRTADFREGILGDLAACGHDPPDLIAILLCEPERAVRAKDNAGWIAIHCREGILGDLAACGRDPPDLIAIEFCEPNGAVRAKGNTSWTAIGSVERVFGDTYRKVSGCRSGRCRGTSCLSEYANPCTN